MDIKTFKNTVARSIAELKSKNKAKAIGMALVYQGEESPEGVNVINIPFSRDMAKAMADNHREKTIKQIKDAESNAPRVKRKIQEESEAMREARKRLENE